MKISDSYPYPVLHQDNDDYINSEFIVDFHVEEAFGLLKINATFSLDNYRMKELIKSDDAIYMIHIECPQTSYRWAYKTNESQIDISIPTKLLRGKVSLHSFIIAQKSINGYMNEALSDWYKDIDINFEKGNFLAIGKAIEVTLHEDDTELLNLPSIVDIHKSFDQEFMDVDIHWNNIIITLPEYEYNQYASNANSMYKSTILSMVILPSLVYVFSKIRENREDLEEYTWYQVMEKIFTENNYRFEDVGTDRLPSIKAAQLVLRKPLKTSFEEIEKMSNMGD